MNWIYVNILDTFFESLFSKRIHSRECHHFRLISNGKTYLTLSGNDDKEAFVDKFLKKMCRETLDLRQHFCLIFRLLGRQVVDIPMNPFAIVPTINILE